VAWNRRSIASFDLVLVATAHACVDHGQLARWATTIVDTRNAMASVRTRRGQVWKA
jgi:UDP-N-acetyl-D-glucosamine dehydrogenase